VEADMICGLRRVMVIGMLTSLSAPARVHGDPAPAADKRALARQYVEAGLAAQRAGDYDTAVTMYQKAYQLVQHPVLIFNIAQAHRLAGRGKEALTLYRRYVAEAPEGDEASTAREFIAELEAQLARSPRNAPATSAGGPAAAPETGAVRPAAPPATSAARAVPAPTTSSPHVAPLPAAPPRIAGEDARAWRSQLPLIVGSGGALVLAGAAGVYLWSRSTYDSANDERTNQDHRSSLESSANTKRHVALGMAGAGLVCGGVAAWLHFHQRGEERAATAAASAHVVPLFSGSTAGLVVLGGF
jgi:tetratricopeptide (TPR) repeat protein